MNERLLFEAAIERQSPQDRAAYLDDVCADDGQLRARLEILLHQFDHPDPLLDSPPWELATTAIASVGWPTGVGDDIGPYKLREQIGEGGMGIVYVAEQTEPIRRKVALKVIRPGMDSKEVIARFEAEKQALALMDHPHVARVIDAGSTQQGHPYFVMELVRGFPITEYCDRAKVDTRARLELFLKVCQGVQHAHRKGIIHRDLKPSNVLVTLNGGEPIPKVIDFGVAKALNQRLTEHTVYTQFQQMIGTPAYMSPEQAEMTSLDVDTRTDVYSLGVLLYELLTGATPFDKEALKSKSFDEMRRIIREQDPLRPSARISTLKATAQSTLQQHRGIDTRQLSQSLKRELDWIVMKALEKDRTRRYESVAALVQDVEHYLADERVLACPPSTAYRLRKYAKRHTFLLSTVTLVLATAVVGTAVSLRYARQSSQSAAQAKSSAEQAREAQAQAEQHATAAEQARKWSQTLLYAADMKLASDAIANEDIPRAAELLQRHVPDAGDSDQRGFEWYLYHKQISPPPGVVLAHGGWIDDLEGSPNGSWLATTGRDGSVFVFGTADWTKHWRFQTQTESVEGVAWSPDGNRLAAACGDGTLRIWDLNTGALQLTIAAHPEFAEEVEFSPDGRILYSCGGEPVVRAWDAQTGAPRIAFHGHEEAVTDVAASTDGRLLATASGDRTFAVWDAETGQRLHVCVTDQSGGRVTCVAFSPDNRFVAAGNIYGAVHLLETHSGRSQLLTQQPDGVEALTFFSGGRWLATADRGGGIQLHELPQNTSLKPAVGAVTLLRWRAHEGRALSLAVTRDGKHLASGGRDGWIRIWSPNPEATRWSVESRGTLSDFVPVTNNQLYVSGHSIDRWDLTERRRLDRFAEIDSTLVYWRRLACSGDGRRLAAWQQPGRLSLFDLGARREIAHWTVKEPEPLDAMALSPDGRWLALAHATQRGQVTLYEQDHTEPRRLLPALQCDALAFSPDSHWLAAGQQNDVLLYLVSDEEEPRVLSGHTNTVSAICFSPSGDLLATASHDRLLKVWHPATGELLFSLVAHRGRVDSVAFSPDGRTIATAGDDRQVRLWHTATGQPLGELPREEASFARVQFSDDGLRLITMGVSPHATVYDASPSRYETQSVSKEQE